MPVLNIYGRYDHLVPPEACELLTSRVGSKDTQDICLDTGHIGIYVSSKCQKELTPRIVQWMKERDAIPAREPETEAVSSNRARRTRPKAIDMEFAPPARKRRQ
jgi:polyhydroxyalkanoate synthase